MKYSITVNLLCVSLCMLSANTFAGPLDRFKKPQKQLLEAFKYQKAGKATRLLQESPHLAQVKDEHGFNLAHWAAATLNPQLLDLAIRYKVDLQQEDHMGKTPIDILGQAFMERCLMDGCRHTNHSSPTTNRLPANEQENIVVAKNEARKKCRRIKAQKQLEDCMLLFLSQKDKLTEKKYTKLHNDTLVKKELFESMGHIPSDLQNLIFEFASTKFNARCDKWQESASHFLQDSPAPRQHHGRPGNKALNMQWIMTILQ